MNIVSAISLTIISSGIFRNRLLTLRGLGSPSRDFLFISSVNNLEKFRISFKVFPVHLFFHLRGLGSPSRDFLFISSFT